MDENQHQRAVPWRPLLGLLAGIAIVAGSLLFQSGGSGEKSAVYLVGLIVGTWLAVDSIRKLRQARQ